MHEGVLQRFVLNVGPDKIEGAYVVREDHSLVEPVTPQNTLSPELHRNDLRIVTSIALDEIKIVCVGNSKRIRLPNVSIALQQLSASPELGVRSFKEVSKAIKDGSADSPAELNELRMSASQRITRNVTPVHVQESVYKETEIGIRKSIKISLPILISS